MLAVTDTDQDMIRRIDRNIQLNQNILEDRKGDCVEWRTIVKEEIDRLLEKRYDITNLRVL